MKDRLAIGCIAAATIAGAAQAQAQDAVQITGIMDVSVGADKAPGGTSIKGVNSGKMTTSMLAVRASEDLGGGLTAQAVLETFVRADTGASGRFDGDPFWSRNAYIALSSKALGTARVGRVTTPLFVQTLLFNAFGDSFGFSPSIRHYFTSGTVTGDTVWADSILYSAPDLGPVRLNLQVAAGEGDGGRNWGANASYSGKPFAASFSYQDVEKGAVIADTKTWQLAGSWDFAVARVFAQLGEVKSAQPQVDFKLTHLSVSVPIGLGHALLGYGKVDPNVGAGRDTVSAGYDHNLSKRTDVYAVVMRDKLDGLSAGRSYAVGIRHRY